MIDHGKDAIDERLTLSVILERASIFSEQEDDSTVALSEQVLAHLPPGFVFKLNALDALDRFEVGHGKPDLHKVSPREWAGCLG
ncbi:hypothetical protein JQ636_35525 [Bradyrhizobium japonicum]|uniref:hypothetical protein n=1 Tax=Bradyrhizobium japonicum TaxID=375 RepID=UPI001BABEA49|nr:hypothetical protein [Bradyrhizobium japonicum]MBR0733806.1 hypothetical protein [Bradyrhizobium japonicum]MBR0808870.1 hypothetical protein [Bradyrhizobium japonicum]